MSGFFFRKAADDRKSAPAPPFTGTGERARLPEEKPETFYRIKDKVHRHLIDSLRLEVVDSLEATDLRPEIAREIKNLLDKKNALISEQEIQILIDEILDELKGLGPLEPLLKDPTVSDILCNSYDDIFVERYGLLEKTGTRFLDETHMMNIIDKIVSRVGRRIDELTPMVDARLPDGSRVNAIIPPLALDGPVLSIRRFGLDPLKMEDLIEHHSLTPQIAQFLGGCVKAKLNIMISGGTGSGKTTLLNVLSGYIPSRERIITIEDAAELQLQQKHVVRLETRPPNIEGRGVITQRDLVRNALRMRPDRIIVGEVRSEEAFDMLQAMNTGHEGSLTTIHANSPRDSLTRLESMVMMTGVRLPETSMRFMLSSALDVVIQVSRLSDGQRKITSVSEITGMEKDIITLHNIFVFEKLGTEKNGKVKGRFRATGIRPQIAEKLRVAGIDLPSDYFSPETPLK